MKKLFLATTAIVALIAVPAGAADMRVKAAPVIKPACANFGGWYFGGHVGWNYYKHEMRDFDNYGFGVFGMDHVESVLNSENSWHGGVQGGYNWQSGCAVFGVQVDWSWTDADASSFHTDFPLANNQNLNASSNLHWFGTVRARTGVVVDNLLLYVTGGLAFARFERELTYNNGLAVLLPAANATQVFSSDRTRLGFVVGAGTEWAINANWSLVSEFLYMGFERDEQTFACSFAATAVNPGTCGQGLGISGTPFRFEFTDSIWVSRIGLNYRFNYAPVVAKF